MRSSFVVGLFGALAIHLLGPATAIAEDPVVGTVQPVVYGTDDRLDWYQIPVPAMQSLGRDAIVAIMPAGTIDFANPGTRYPPLSDAVESLTEFLQRTHGVPLCAGERFADQPSSVRCSGTLIDDDLVITAGHCARTQAACDAMQIVFDYYEASAGTLAPIDATDVYRCTHVLAQLEQSSPHLDYAVIQLDRPAAGRVPVTLRAARTPLAFDTPIVVFGFGTGLPMKYDAGATVKFGGVPSVVDSFIADTDTFAGNSGSGAFATDGTMVGIMVFGNSDYVDGPTCTSVNVLDPVQANEQGVYAFHAVDALCAGGFPSALCPSNPAPACGDRFCSGGEDAASCAVDCAALHCADGVCSWANGETEASCPYDCAGMTPPPPAHHGRCSVSVATVAGRGSHTGELASSLLLVAFAWRRARRLGARQPWVRRRS